MMALLLGEKNRNSGFIPAIITVCMIMLSGCMEKATGDITGQPYTPEWKSLEQHHTPEWLMDAKFGIYFHWGVYSVPAVDENYSRNMYLAGTEEKWYHLETYGSLTTFGYKDFIPLFEAGKFDPGEWAGLFAASGAKFAGPVAEYADGFAMWDSDVSSWNAAAMGPCRDVVGELETAIRSRGLKFITAFSRQWHWGWYPTYVLEADTSDPAYEGLYGPAMNPDAFKFTNPNPPPSESFQEHWLAEVREVVDKYHPDLLYFNGRMGIIGEEYRKEMLSHYYNTAPGWGENVSAVYDVDKLEMDIDLVHEKAETASFKIFESSIDRNSRGYRWNASYKTSDELVAELVDRVSKNGAYLLNITPRADGTIPDAVRTRLENIGEWLNINGEAIYGTRPWLIPGDSNVLYKYIRFTQSKDGRFLYAILLTWPGDGMVIAPLSFEEVENAGGIVSISMLGSKRQLAWLWDINGLMVQLPDQKPCDHAYVVKIEWGGDSEPDVTANQ